jgi:excinuclease ABC subunit C
MRDDKQYAYVGITDEDFPQVIMTRQLTGRATKVPFRHFIGPFTDASALRSTLNVLARLFPTCRCKSTHHVRCLNAHIGRCPGYCCLREPATTAQKREYAKRIRAIRDLLMGKRRVLVGRLTAEMKRLGATHRLEEAQELKELIARIERVYENAQLNASRRRASIARTGALEQLETELTLTRTPQRIEGYDIAHLQGQHPSGVMVVFEDGTSDSSQYRLFNIRESSGDTGMLRETLARRLSHAPPAGGWPLPDLIVVDGGKAQLNAMLRVLAEHEVEIPVIALTKDERHQADHILTSQDSRVRVLGDLPRAMRDLIVRVDDEAHRFVVKHYRKRHRKATTRKRHP